MKAPPKHWLGEGDMTLLDICLELHMENTGSTDGMDPDRYHELRDYLQHRVDNWRDNGFQTARREFDLAVYRLCRATLDEPHWDQR